MPLPTPKGRQAEVLALAAKGHIVVLGTAGGGKSTLAILRSAFLASKRHSGGGPTLLLTFNGALVHYLRYLKEEAKEPELSNVTIETYHKFARGYLNVRGKMTQGCICPPLNRTRALEKAIISCRLSFPAEALFRRAFEILSDEIAWISGNGIDSEQGYVEARRTGRGSTRLARSQRPAMFALFEHYLVERTNAGFSYDWDDIGTTVLTELEADSATRRYSHIVIDEGQDFSLQMLRSLAALMPANGSLTFFGDAAQQIYGSGTPWKAAGFTNVGIWRFEDNYRNSKQIAALAIAVSQMPFYGSSKADIVMPTLQAAAGPLPSLVGFATRSDELAFVSELAKETARARSVGVLVMTHKGEGEVIRALGNPGGIIRLNKDMAWQSGNGLFVGTIFAAKGLEFDSVILPFCSETELPAPANVETYGSEDAAERDGRLLYVGITRARTELVITFTGTASALLPNVPDLYQSG